MRPFSANRSAARTTTSTSAAPSRGRRVLRAAALGPRRRGAATLACVAALSESGEGFDVTTSYGAVVVPAEAATPTTALKLADRRMYARKGRQLRGTAEVLEREAVHAA
jgi:hypothetical protein